MKCPQCGNDTFVELDCDSYNRRGQCKVGPNHCCFSESVDYVRGWWAALKSLEAHPQADNNRYAAALEVFEEFLESTDGGARGPFLSYCRERLNAEGTSHS